MNLKIGTRRAGDSNARTTRPRFGNQHILERGRSKKNKRKQDRRETPKPQGKNPIRLPLGEGEREQAHTKNQNRRTNTPRMSPKTATLDEKNKEANVMSQNKGVKNTTDAGKNMDGQRRFATRVAPTYGMDNCEEDLRKAFAYLTPAVREEIIRTYTHPTEDKENKTELGEKWTGKERSFNKLGLYFHVGWKTEKRA